MYVLKYWLYYSIWLILTFFKKIIIIFHIRIYINYVQHKTCILLHRLCTSIMINVLLVQTILIIYLWNVVPWRCSLLQNFSISHMISCLFYISWPSTSVSTERYVYVRKIRYVKHGTLNRDQSNVTKSKLTVIVSIHIAVLFLISTRVIVHIHFPCA